MKQNTKAHVTANFFNFLYILIPISQLVLELRAAQSRQNESPSIPPDSGAYAELKTQNVMYKLVITCAGLALSAYLKHFVMTKLKQIPNLLKSRRSHA